MAGSPILYDGPPFCHSKLCLHVGYLDHHLIHGSLGQPLSKWHLDWFSRFAGLTTVTDRQTDHTALSVSVAIGCIYIVLWCSLLITLNSTLLLFFQGRYQYTCMLHSQNANVSISKSCTWFFTLLRHPSQVTVTISVIKWLYAKDRLFIELVQLASFSIAHWRLVVIIWSDKHKDLNITSLAEQYVWHSVQIVTLNCATTYTQILKIFIYCIVTVSKIVCQNLGFLW